MSPIAATVRVAALAPDRELNDAVDAAPGAPRPLPAATRTEIQQQYLNPLADDMFRRTAQAARSGAKIVVWSEAASFVFKEHPDSFLKRAQSVALQEHIYLQIGLVSLLPTNSYPTNENRAIMIEPNGSVSWDYPKSTEVFTDGNQPGPGLVPTLASEYFMGADYTMIVNVPTTGARTLYIGLGGSVGWLCVLAVPALAGLAWVRRAKWRRSS